MKKVQVTIKVVLKKHVKTNKVTSGNTCLFYDVSCLVSLRLAAIFVTIYDLMFMFRALQKNRNVIFLVISPEVCGLLLAEAFLEAKKVKPSPCLPLEMPTTSARRLKRRSTTTGKQLRSSRRRVAHCQALFDRCRTCLADFSFDRIVEYKRTYRTFVTVSSWCRTWVTSFSERMRIELQHIPELTLTYIVLYICCLSA